MKKIVSVKNCDEKHQKQKKNLGYKISLFCTATIVSLTNVGCGLQTNEVPVNNGIFSENDFSYDIEEDDRKLNELRGALFSLFDADIGISSDEIYIYKNSDGLGYLLSYGLFDGRTDGLEVIGTFKDYDISSELLIFNKQVSENSSYYREYIRNYNQQTGEYDNWVPTDNINDLPLTPSHTSMWQYETVNNIVTYNYEDLNVYTTMSFVIPKNKTVDNAMLTVSAIYIGLDNYEENLESSNNKVWEHKDNLSVYVDIINGNNLERGSDYGK